MEKDPKPRHLNKNQENRTCSHLEQRLRLGLKAAAPPGTLGLRARCSDSAEEERAQGHLPEQGAT